MQSLAASSSGAAPRPLPGRKRSEQAREAVIAATLGTLREVGYRQLTVEGVAARAGVAKATIYRWWPSKASLSVEALGQDLGVPLQPTGDTRVDIRAMVDRIVTAVGGLFGDIVVADFAGDPLAGPRLEDLLGPYRAAHSAILLGAAGRGDLPHNIDAGKILDLISGVVLYRKLMRRPVDGSVADELVTLILSGQLPRMPSLPR